MDYPLLLGGEKAGTLRIEQQGLYTCMEVTAEARDGLLRIWVQGGGREAYLGILQPEGESLSLRRRLSRRELAAFPPVIEQASDQQLPPQEKVDITHESQAPVQALALPAPEPTPEAPTPVSALEPEPELQPELTPSPEPEPQAPSTVETPTLIWQERRDGSLVAKEGSHTLLALPARLRRAPQGADLRCIGGREYLVFHY